MASMQSIARLYQGQRTDLVQTSAQVPKDVSAQPSMLDMQTLAWQFPLRRRFGPPGRHAAPPMMNSITPTGIPEGRSSFGALAMRDVVQQMRATAMRRYSQQAQRAEHQPWMRIQI